MTMTHADWLALQEAPTAEVTIEAGDLQIGAVEMKDGATDTRAKVAAVSGLASSDNGIPVADPVLAAAIGTTAGAAVTTDANGTMQQYLRGIATILGAVTASPVANSVGDRLKTLATSLASILAKLPALGTAGTSSADVISIQGVASGTVVPVAGNGNVIAVTPTVSASPDYSIGDAVGGIQTLANAVRTSGGFCLLESIQIIDIAAVKPVVDILIFDSNPAAATVTDNSGFVYSTDIAKLVFRKSITTSDYNTAINAICTANVTGINAWIKASGSTSLFVVVVAQAAINLAGTADLRFDYGVIYQ